MIYTLHVLSGHLRIHKSVMGSPGLIGIMVRLIFIKFDSYFHDVVKLLFPFHYSLNHNNEIESFNILT